MNAAVAMLVLLLAGDLAGLESRPYSCRQLWMWEEKCRLGACSARQIERWRERCKRDSTQGHQQ